MTILSGPFAGRTKKVTNEDPAGVLGICLHHRWRWEVDYSKATPEEAFLWGRQDLACRCVLALSEGRSVFFLGKEYKASSIEEGKEMAGILEDAIVASGRNVSIDSDDERGVVIGVYGWEQ